MNEEKFTPGPWFAYRGTVYCVNDMRNYFVVTTEANAALIAAAPEMYELLDCIRKSVALDAGIMAGCIARIEPLLKKARGEEC